MKPRSYTYDLPLDERQAPSPGDLIRHTTLVKQITSWYEVLDAMPVESRVWGNRWRLKVRRLATAPTAALIGARVWPSVPYAPGRRPTATG